MRSYQNCAEMKPLPLLTSLLFASLSISVPAAEVWAPGVSLSGGWFDFNKNDGNDALTDDGNMCWAASAGNVIAWWQNQNGVTNTPYNEHAGKIPQGKDVYQTFVGVFENVGSNPASAFQWWVNGNVTPGTKSDEVSKLSWTGIDGKEYYVGEYGDGGFLSKSTFVASPLYSFSNNPVTIPETNANAAGFSLATQSKAIVNALKGGYALSLEVHTNGETVGNHAITLWGVEYNEDENGAITLTTAYITDSDDYSEEIVSAKVDQKGFLSGMKLENLAYNITNVHGLRTIPEPSAFGLLAGFAALALVASRRRKR